MKTSEIYVYTKRQSMSVYYFYPHAPFSPSDLAGHPPERGRGIHAMSIYIPPQRSVNPPAQLGGRSHSSPTNALQRSGRTLRVSLTHPVRRQLLSLVPPILHHKGTADPPDIINQACFQSANHDKIRLRPRPKVQPAGFSDPTTPASHLDLPREYPAAASPEGPARTILSP